MPSKNQPQKNHCTHLSPTGRRCRALLAPDHDSLCVYHHRREQQLDPSTSPEAREIVSQVLGTREQFKTATEVNEALAKVFALRGRKLISVRDATLFAYLSQLLLYSIDSVRHEFIQVYELNEWDKIIERILQLPGATLPPLDSAGASSDDVIPRSAATRDPSSPRAASHPTSSTEDSSRPPRPKRNKKSGLLPATSREFAQQVFTQVAADRAARRERTAARVAQLERQLDPSASEQSEETHALTSA
jgi:hypothetical protein